MLPHSDDVYQSHREVLGVITNVRDLGRKRGFRRNYCWKHNERKTVEPCITSTQAEPEALWRVRWPLLIKWTQEKGEGVDKTIEDLSAKLAPEFTPGEDNPAIDTTVHSYLINQARQAS